MRSIDGRWMVDLGFRGRYLRLFFKQWARPYRWSDYGLWAFGIGPIGCMYWPKREQKA